jgi:hypothetical protein
MRISIIDLTHLVSRSCIPAVSASAAEWTLDGELQQTTFLGWREDKDPKEVAHEA